MNRLFFLLAPAALLVSCASVDTADSSTVKQDEIYQSYTVVYNAGGGPSTANAVFRFGGSTGTTLRLSSPSKVEYNGNGMVLSNFLGTGYSTDLKGYQPKHTFVFTDTEGKTYTNALEVPAADFNDSLMTVADGKPFTLGVDFDNPDGVSITARDTAGIDETVILATAGAPVYFDKAARTITVSPAFFQNVKMKDCKLQLQSGKTTSPITQGTHLGGTMSVEYNSRPLHLKRANAI